VTENFADYLAVKVDDHDHRYDVGAYKDDYYERVVIKGVR
jgi:hypothetical protein